MCLCFVHVIIYFVSYTIILIIKFDWWFVDKCWLIEIIVNWLYQIFISRIYANNVGMKREGTHVIMYSCDLYLPTLCK